VIIWTLRQVSKFTLDGGEFIPPNASESDHELEFLFTLDGSAFLQPDASHYDK
jgi:hypothetical protein